jgi:hypothetical protein
MSCPSCFKISRVPNFYPKIYSQKVYPPFESEKESQIRILFQTRSPFISLKLEKVTKTKSSEIKTFRPKIFLQDIPDTYESVLSGNYRITLQDMTLGLDPVSSIYPLRDGNYYTIVVLDDSFIFSPDGNIVCPLPSFNRIIFHNLSGSTLSQIHVLQGITSYNGNSHFKDVRDGEMVVTELPDNFYSLRLMSANKENNITIPLDLFGNVIYTVFYFSSTQIITIPNYYCNLYL